MALLLGILATAASSCWIHSAMRAAFYVQNGIEKKINVTTYLYLAPFYEVQFYFVDVTGLLNVIF